MLQTLKYNKTYINTKFKVTQYFPPPTLFTLIIIETDTDYYFFFF